MAKVKIRYMGIADERILPMKALKARGVEVPRDLVFNRSNAFAVTIDDATSTLLDVIREQGAFKVEEINEGNLPGQEIVEATNPDDTGAVILDGTTGARTERATTRVPEPKPSPATAPKP